MSEALQHPAEKMDRMDASYILPIKTEAAVCTAEFTEYLREIAREVELIIVDGSAPEVFAEHANAWSAIADHRPPIYETMMGKVGGVLTGLERASHERVVIADDDVRYDIESLRRIVRLLDDAEVVRPQNFFDPLPWHARWDTGRILLNRAAGGDWPGTLAVRRSSLLEAGGYRGDVMFENLELVRTLRAAGGRERVAYDLFVRRLPPTARHFWSQRVRQAYDELARPARLAIQLAILPLLLGLGMNGRRRLLAAGALAVVAIAEAGRRRGGGTSVFRPTASVWAPLWLLERSVTSWMAVGARVLLGGIPYRDGVVPEAASSMRKLRRHRAAPLPYRDGPESRRPEND